MGKYYDSVNVDVGIAARLLIVALVGSGIPVKRDGVTRPLSQVLYFGIGVLVVLRMLSFFRYP